MIDQINILIVYEAPDEEMRCRRMSGDLAHHYFAASQALHMRIVGAETMGKIITTKTIITRMGAKQLPEIDSLADEIREVDPRQDQDQNH